MSKPLPEPQSHNPVPPCHCERCTGATIKATDIRVELLKQLPERSRKRMLERLVRAILAGRAKW